MYPENLDLRKKIIMIIATILILIIGNTLLLVLPQTKGFLIDDIDANTIMSFNRINYRLNSGHLLSYPDKGFLVPLEMNSKPVGFAIYAKGYIAHEEEVHETTESYIFLQEDEYYDLIGDLYLLKSEESFFVDTANNSIADALRTTPFLELPIGRKYYPMSEAKGSIVTYKDSEFLNITSISSNLFHFPIYLLTAIIHILFLIAIGYIIVLITDKKSEPLLNRSLDIHFISYRPLQLVILSTIIWLGLLYFNGDIVTVQIVLMIALGYIFYHLIFIDRKRMYDLRLINYSFGDFVILPITVGLISYLIFGNTSISLRYFSFNVELVEFFFVFTSYLWVCFVSFSFIHFIIREFDLTKHENTIIIIFNVLLYFAFLSISDKSINMFTIMNGLIFIPLYAVTLNMFAKRVFNFIPVFATINVIYLLINSIR